MGQGGAGPGGRIWGRLLCPLAEGCSVHLGRVAASRPSTSPHAHPPLPSTATSERQAAGHDSISVKPPGCLGSRCTTQLKSRCPEEAAS